MALTDTVIRNAKPDDKPFKMSDEKGMYLYVAPTGGKLWRLKYRFDGKEKLLSMGAYPDVSLKDARARRDEARKLLANGIDPGENRKIQKAAKVERAANSFEVIAREWFAKYSPGWSTSHSGRTLKRLENDVFPWIGGRPVAELTASEVLAVLRRIEGRGTLDTAHRAHQNCVRYSAMPWPRGALYVIQHPTCGAPCLQRMAVISQPSQNRLKSAPFYVLSMVSRGHSLCNAR